MKGSLVCVLPKDINYVTALWVFWCLDYTQNGHVVNIFVYSFKSRFHLKFRNDVYESYPGKLKPIKAYQEVNFDSRNLPLL